MYYMTFTATPYHTTTPALEVIILSISVLDVRYSHFVWFSHLLEIVHKNKTVRLLHMQKQHTDVGLVALESKLFKNNGGLRTTDVDRYRTMAYINHIFSCYFCYCIKFYDAVNKKNHRQFSFFRN